MGVDVGADPDGRTSPDGTTAEHGAPLFERAALWVFVAVETGAFFFYLDLGRSQWFFLDEWYFIAGRGMGDTLRSHVGHWVTLPVVVYRVLWWAVGLRSYLPYVAMTIGLHLTAAALLRMVMRRSGIGPWTATTSASAFVLFGTGAQDILWAFQIAFTGALVFGLLHLLLADHSGPVDRRDWLGLGVGLLGLMCSGVAVTMVIVVGFSVLIRRGWRIALLHTVPLGVVFSAWWLRYGRTKTVTGSISDVGSWTRSGVTGVFDALGQHSATGWVLGAALVGGVVIALRDTGWKALRERSAPTVGLLFGVPVFLAITGAQRSAILGYSLARSGRYQHILAALLLPGLALGAHALSRRWRALAAVVLVALLLGVPGNVSESTRFARYREPIASRTRLLMTSIPRMKLAAKVPSSLRPEPNSAMDVTIGWLRAGVVSGRIPAPHGQIPRLTNTLRLSLMELDSPSEYPCRPLRSPRVLTMKKGDAFGVRGAVGVAMLVGRQPASSIGLGVRFPNAVPYHTLVAVAGPLVIRVTPATLFATTLICLSDEAVSGE